ncbi:Tn3 family transposase [Pseudobacteriovorax antillogorgiicola]|uniref:Transposase and inactivated derivatives, TnpA family n=1 Tax=Pseudobacteriovorax antillogorgiicola TaxID=1513793 RepID=A0A1Y6CPR6_9BACT|nr:Tn3 family transposase [Pseudobacteriovorax antillogorgiicola]TCS44209.1 TnpA family transposase [Pseudobacteriovorax antillogorgiicola]SMF80417.1 Transposase and inactivated derivatives, TnpA family [Pseudobacteriovorax antillogorgiicola]
MSSGLHLSDQELRLVNSNKKPDSKLGFSILLKFLQLRGYFPQDHHDVPLEVVSNIADQLDINGKLFKKYDIGSRSCRNHKAQIKKFLGFRDITKPDYTALNKWLCKELSFEHGINDFVSEANNRLLKLKIVASNQDQIIRTAKSSLNSCEDAFFNKIHRKIPKRSKSAIDEILSANSELSLTEIKSDPGKVGIESLIKESKKLAVLREIDLPDSLFTQSISKKHLIKLKRRLSSESLHEITRHPPNIKYSLFAAFTHVRIQEITDGLVDLLIQIIHKIGARAENKVTKELVRDFKKVRNKDSIFCRVAEAAVSNPKGKVEQVIFPVANENVLKDIVKELKATGPFYRYKVQNVMRASYVHHYRKMVPVILDCLDFCSNNSRHKPVIDGIELIKIYQDSTKQMYSDSDDVPINGVVKNEWMSFVLQGNRINRANYELALLDSLRSRLRCKEIWVPGSFKYCNPDEDLPQDFHKKRVAYFDKLKLDLDPKVFVKDLENQMRSSLTKLNQQMPNNDSVKIHNKKGGWISVSPLVAQEEPPNILNLKRDVMANWPMTNLLDILKETELRVGFTEKFETVGVRERMGKETLQRRLLLSLFGLGTNMGLKRVCTTTSMENFQDLSYIKKKFINRDNLRNAISSVANAIFDIRMADIWGEGSTACASDSKKFGSWDQNLMTEWHIRYGGRGVMIYWHVEKKSTCIYSQLKACSSSEVASMIEGILKHNTAMEIDKNYVDSHGQSEVAFAFCHLLGFKLMPRLKAINRQKLYLPGTGESGNYKNLKEVLTRPIRWDLIVNQYDEMIKHIAALKLGFADAETILKRFTRNNLKHPTYLAFCELGKAIKTIFLCEYLGSMELRREINEGLNVVENWNSANGFLFFGKNSEIASNCIADQEISILALHLLQISMVYVNTIMIQQVLATPQWNDIMTKEDYRALTPLIYTHINPYGSFHLDMGKRIALAA